MKLGQGNIFTSVCLSTEGEGWCLPQCMLGYPWDLTPPWEQTPLGADPLGVDPPGSRHHPEQTPPGSRPPQSRHPPEQTPPRSRPPRSRHPPEQTPPRSRHTTPPEAECSIRLTSGRYASYWNAFLLKKYSPNMVDFESCDC